MKDISGNKIPMELNETLSEISKDIPVCIVSSKDYDFLYDKIRFARIVSCILGIETIAQRHDGNDDVTAKNGSNSHLITDIRSIIDNSKLLDSLGMEISQTFKDVTVEHKYTSRERILAGITIDYRHLEDWVSYKTKMEPIMYERIQQTRKSHLSSSESKLYVEVYSTHPFLDIYGIKCDKGSAFNSVLKFLNMDRSKTILYLGDSENDNPAFAKADVSIGVQSDRRLHPSLNCRYTVDFDRLPVFLRRLSYDKFEFSEKLLY
jgi:HAD superfamily hydrolase (TIGR01484 family)